MIQNKKTGNLRCSGRKENMTERELAKKLAPQIAEIINEIEKMSMESFFEWKEESLSCAKEQGNRAYSFMSNVIKLIETFIKENHIEFPATDEELREKNQQKNLAAVG